MLARKKRKHWGVGDRSVNNDTELQLQQSVETNELFITLISYDLWAETDWTFGQFPMGLYHCGP